MLYDEHQPEQGKANSRTMRTFLLIWFGQVVSLLGSSLTKFALSVWVFQLTNSVTEYGLISVFTIVPVIIISPVAGMIVDRWNQRYCMLLSDLLASMATVTIATLLAIGKLEIWHIYVASIVKSSCDALQSPAYTSAITKLVPDKYLSNASGLINLGKSITQLLSPILAGILITTIQIQGVIIVDIISFLIAVVTLAFAKVPVSKIRDKHIADNWRSAIFYGWTYIKSKPSLFALLLLTAAINFSIGFVEVLVTPLVLSFASAATLGIVFSIGGSGMLLGSLVMSFGRASKHYMRNIFTFMLLCGVSIFTAGLKPEVSLFTFAAFLFFFGIPILYGSIQVIFQKKVPPDLQGRVFSINSTVASSFLPLAFLIAGPLADKVFEPLMRVDGPLAGSVGKIIGVGAGRGMGLMFIVMGLLIIVATFAAYMYRPLRNVEIEP
jgi:MFS transporter, DHA3 family, macrolide efflux protein